MLNKFEIIHNMSVRTIHPDEVFPVKERTMFKKTLPFLMCLAAATLCFHAADSSAQSEKPGGLAVMHLKGMGISEIEAETLTETLHSSVSQLLANPSAPLKEKYSLLERAQMDKILEQFNVQNSGCVDDSCAVQFGRMLAVQRIIVGSIGLVGETYMISGRMVDVESSKVVRAVSRKYQGKIDGVLDIIPLVGHELLTGVRLPDPPRPLQRLPQNASRPVEQPTISYLTIEGKPGSAEAFVNGQSLGQTPVHSYAILPGKYTVTVRIDGFQEHKEEVVIAPGKSRTVRYALSPIGKITIESMPAGAEVVINGKRAGETPLRDLTVNAGENTIKIKRLGYETHSQRVEVRQSESGGINPVLIPKTNRGVLKRSAFLPGYGQWYAEFKGKGLCISFLQAATIAGIVGATLQVSDAEKKYDDAYAAYKQVQVAANLDAARAEMNAKYDDFSTAKNMQTIALGAVAAVYLYNVIDAVFTEPKVEVKLPEKSLYLEPRLKPGYAVLSANMRF